MSFGRELIQSAKEALAIAKGESEPAGIYVPEAVDGATIFNASTKPNLPSTEKLSDKAAAARGATAASAQSAQTVHLPGEGTSTETRRDAPS